MLKVMDPSSASDATHRKKYSAEMKVLVTGGAGYIGSHLIEELLKMGAECFVLDNLSRGLVQRVSKNAAFKRIDLCDFNATSLYLGANQFDAVFHLAGYMQARESSRIPNQYWANNLNATKLLLDSLPNLESTKFVFSSSCSVYGNNDSALEYSQLNPLSIYARTKVEAENEIQRAFSGLEKNLTVFRFFNVIGCLEKPFFCDIQQETLLPSMARLLLQGKKPIIYGNDYQTADGFAIRDFIDVRDLVKALVLPLTTNLSGIHNLSSSQSSSIREVVQLTLEMSNLSGFDVDIKPRNIEDPSIICSAASKEVLDLGWKPEYRLKDSIRNFWLVFSEFHESQFFEN
jgi:UDP-glucose 4-epimerase